MNARPPNSVHVGGIFMSQPFYAGGGQNFFQMTRHKALLKISRPVGLVTGKQNEE